jgi:hypothetical protein
MQAVTRITSLGDSTGRILVMPEERPLPTVVRELLDPCEKLYFERTILETLLKESLQNWGAMYEQAVHNHALRARVHRIFEDAAIKLRNADLYEGTLQSLLSYLECRGKPN